MKFAPLLPLLLFLMVPCGHSSDKVHDVVIYGASSSGFIAAIQTAKLGKSVVLVEPSEHIGGMNVEGLGNSDIDNFGDFRNSPAVGGLALDFYRRIARHYGNGEAFEAMLAEGKKDRTLWRFEPHVAEKVILDWLGEHPVEIVTGARLIEGTAGVVKEGSKLLSISTSKGDFRGKIFIDATIEGDLLDSAGVTTVIGREPNSRYGETMNGIRAETTHHQFAVEVDPYRVPGDSSSGTLSGVLDEAFGEPGSGDHRIQAYCFRVCFTDDPENRLPLPKPEQYDRGNYELHLRYLRAGGKFYHPGVNLPNRKTDFNGGRDLSHNLNGMNHGYPDGSDEQRREILIHHRDYTQGLFWFLANDPEVGRLAPEFQEGWSRWGLPKDEFTDNGGWPRMFYVRDARRMLSDYVITEHHVRKTDPVPVEDPVAVAYWPPDVHNVRTIVVDGHAYNEGFVFGGDDWRPFGISYRALVPKAAEASNLLTPTCPSSSHIAYGAIRIEFTFMALGQACATAAAHALENGLSVQEVPYAALRDQLLEDGQVLVLEE